MYYEPVQTHIYACVVVLAVNYNIDNDTTDFVKLCIVLAILPHEIIVEDSILQLIGELFQKAYPCCHELPIYGGNVVQPHT